MRIRIVIASTVAVLLAGCSSRSTEFFLLPNNVLVPASPVDSIETRIPLTYYPYRGFTGVLSDSLFPSFRLLQETQERRIKFVIMNRFQQAELHASPVTGIQLDRMRGRAVDSARICMLVLQRYPRCQLLSYIPFDHSLLRAWDLIDQETGQQVGTLQHPVYSDQYILELVPF